MNDGVKGVWTAVAGVLLAASALPHGFLAWPEMRARLADVDAPAGLVGGLGAGWWFGTAAMITFGAVVLAAGLRVRRGDHSLVFAARAVSMCYLVFGVVAFLMRDMNPHFLFHVGLGILTGIPAFSPRKER